jgi:Zn-dependent protease with chaperone function
MNIFLTLCITVCLAIFLITALIGALVTELAARLFRFQRLQEALIGFPELLFVLRISPLALGLVCSLGFALPSFLVLEPRQTTEKPELTLLILAGLAAALLSIFVGRCARSLLTTRRIVQGWQRTAQILSIPGVAAPIYGVESPRTLIAVTGLVRPRVFIGRDVLARLSQDELRAAVAHEAAHVRSFDNVKQLILRVTRVPGFCFRQLALLDRAWSRAAEFAADERALRSGASALDLGAALVKVARLPENSSLTASLAASYLIPPDCRSAVGFRVHHLQRLLQGSKTTPRSPVLTTLSATLLPAMSALYLAILHPALPLAHRVIEWLVR